jgi:hypothetical protein
MFISASLKANLLEEKNSLLCQKFYCYDIYTMGHNIVQILYAEEIP